MGDGGSKRHGAAQELREQEHGIPINENNRALD